MLKLLIKLAHRQVDLLVDDSCYSIDPHFFSNIVVFVNIVWDVLNCVPHGPDFLVSSEEVHCSVLQNYSGIQWHTANTRPTIISNMMNLKVIDAW